MAKALPKRSENYSEWYNEIVKRADMAENSAVRGCMVIKPYGYAIWEKMQRALDDMFKATGHVNAYFPLFVPKSFLEKEEEHAEGFAKECAVVTHYRLKANPNGKGLIVDPTAKLEEELIVRPTSEAVIWNTYRNWVQSWRDLPLLINQWCNIVRWEMRTRLFLRTTEFLWQEGHTAHATYEEAEDEARKMLGVYATFAEEYMAVPVLQGLKTEKEKFAGAHHTYCIEGMMQDGKALQAGTSHHLGQNFAKAFDLKFQTETGDWRHAFNTSWGAPTQVVIVPIFKGSYPIEAILAAARGVEATLKKAGIAVKLDARNYVNPGFKFNEWEMLGVPLRIELGPKDLEKGSVCCVKRLNRAKSFVAVGDVATAVPKLLDELQAELLAAAKARRDAATFT